MSDADPGNGEAATIAAGRGAFAELRHELSRRLTAAMPGLVAGEPGAVGAALDVAADVLGDVLGLAKMGCDGDAYLRLDARAIGRADRVAAARVDAAVAEVGRRRA